jgi:hypothetical protein
MLASQPVEPRPAAACKPTDQVPDGRGGGKSAQHGRAGGLLRNPSFCTYVIAAGPGAAVSAHLFLLDGLGRDAKLPSRRRA